MPRPRTTIVNLTTIWASIADITVDGVGRLSLPLPKAQAAQLLAAGEAAPFGKGMATVLDPAVRRATQLDAAKVHFGPGWERTLSDITQGAGGCTH